MLDGEGFRLVRLIVTQVAVPTTAPGAGTDAFFFSGVKFDNSNVAVAAQDPAVDASRDAQKWLGMSTYMAPLIAAPSSTAVQIRTAGRVSRRWTIGKAPRVREADDELYLIINGTNAGQTWRCLSYVYTRWAMP